MAEVAQIAQKQSFSRSTAVKLHVLGSRSRQPSLSSVSAASSLPGQSVEWPVPPVPAINVTSGSTDGHAESTGRSKSTSIPQVPVSAIPIRTKRNEEPLELLERGDDADSDTASESDVFYDASEQPLSSSRARWTPVCSSVRPLRAHTATLVQNYIYIVGGHNGEDCTADVWRVDITADFTWKAVVCTAVRNGALPRPMRAHTAVYIPRCDTHDSPPGHLAVFGGGNGSFYSDELWLLDIYSHEWQKVVIDGPKPSPRRAHAAVFHPGSHRMIVFGGGDGSRAMDDTWVLDCTRPGNFTWSEAVSEGRRPPARAYRDCIFDLRFGTQQKFADTLTLLDDKIVLIGGTDAAACLYYRISERWTQVLRLLLSTELI